jgi:hypothetical protein
MATAKKAAAKKAAPASKAPAAKKAAPAEPKAPEIVPPVQSATEDIQRGEKKREDAAKPTVGSAAWRRADYMRALNEERDMCERSGKADRVKAIDAEISRFKSVKDRQTAPSDEA